jgi:hypothetical protein
MILSYLERTANAEDTIDGIINWWLVAEEIRFRHELVHQALELLLRRNQIVRRQVDERVTYRLKRFEDLQGDDGQTHGPTS